MCITLRDYGMRHGALALLLLLGGSLPAAAENAYISQADAKPSTAGLVRANVQPTPILPAPSAPRQTALVPTPETAAPARSIGNSAQTLEAGNSNQVFQLQAGQNNVSNVGVLGGTGNNVGVLQGGHDTSNLLLVNTQGLSVGVIQPNGSAPVNMLIARLPNGGLLIAR
jgi:hypothetical protein